MWKSVRLLDILEVHRLCLGPFFGLRASGLVFFGLGLRVSGLIGVVSGSSGPRRGFYGDAGFG